MLNAVHVQADKLPINDRGGNQPRTGHVDALNLFGIPVPDLAGIT